MDVGAGEQVDNTLELDAPVGGSEDTQPLIQRLVAQQDELLRELDAAYAREIELRRALSRASGTSASRSRATVSRRKVRSARRRLRRAQRVLIRVRTDPKVRTYVLYALRHPVWGVRTFKAKVVRMRQVRGTR